MTPKPPLQERYETLQKQSDLAKAVLSTIAVAIELDKISHLMLHHSPSTNLGVTTIMTDAIIKTLKPHIDRLAK